MRLAWLFGVCVAIGCGGRGGDRPAIVARAQAGDVAIVGATVVPMDREGTLPGHTILVRGDRIVAVAPAAAIDTAGAELVDATGAWVVPGLADMHVHVWGEDALALFVLNGVTTVRNLFGAPEYLRWRDAIARGERVGPTMVTSGPIIDGEPPTWPSSAVVTTAAEGRAVVIAQHEAGYDWIKVYGRVPAAAYDAILDEAKRVGRPVAGHVPKEVGIARAIASGQRSIEHLDGYVPFNGDLPTEPLVAPTVQSGIWNCPTLVVTDRFARMDDPAALAGTRGLEHVPPFVRAMWNPENDFRLRTFTPEKYAEMRERNVARRKLVGELLRAGAHLVLGTDTGNPYVVPGFAVVEELVLLVASGLTPWQALRTATAAAAELQGTPGAFGVIAAGARADLVVVARDPLADVTHLADPTLVVVRGKPMRRDALLAAVVPATAPPDPFAALPALPSEGTPIVAARYEVRMFDQVIGAERAVLAQLDGGTRVVHGQAIYTVPQSSRLEYRSTADALAITADSITPAAVVVSRRGGRVVTDGSPPLERAAPAGAILAPQAIGEQFWYAAALADLAVGKARTLDVVAVMTDGRLELRPARYTFTRAADAGGRRVYALTGTYGDLDLTGQLTIDADGAPREITVTVKYGTFVTRRLDGPQ